MIGRLSAAVLIAVVVIVLIALGASVAMHAASSELRAEVQEARGAVLRHEPFEVWWAARLASDVASSDVSVRDARGQELDQRADRLIEMSSVVALAGLLLGLLTASPAVSPVRTRSIRRE